MEELVKIEEKGMSIPCKALPEETLNAQVAKLTQWLEVLLGVKDTIDNHKRIASVMIQIKENAWGLSVNQIMEAFKLYVDGKLPLEPMSGFIDSIQFNKVINAYKQQKSPKVDNRQIMYNVNDYFINNKKLTDKEGKMISGVVETFNHLYDVGVLPSRTGASDMVVEAYEKMMMSAGGFLLAPLIDERKKLYEEGMKKTPAYKRIQDEISSIRKQNHPDLLPKFKQLVLESFFRKQKRHLREIL